METILRLTPRESELQNSILCYLQNRSDIFVWRQNTGAMKVDDSRFIKFGFPGMADIIGLKVGGKFLAIEVKSRNGKLNTNQVNFKIKIESMGGIYIEARSLDDVIDGLERGTL